MYAIYVKHVINLCLVKKKTETNDGKYIPILF